MQAILEAVKLWGSARQRAVIILHSSHRKYNNGDAQQRTERTKVQRRQSDASALPDRPTGGSHQHRPSKYNSCIMTATLRDRTTYPQRSMNSSREWAGTVTGVSDEIHTTSLKPTYTATISIVHSAKATTRKMAIPHLTVPQGHQWRRFLPSDVIMMATKGNISA